MPRKSRKAFRSKREKRAAKSTQAKVLGVKAKPLTNGDNHA